MQALRQIHTFNSQSISIKIPKTFMNRPLEIIIIPSENQKAVHVTPEEWPKEFFAKTAGCFSDAPLVREAQGEYEVRDTIK
jgi:hypothetical protein